MSENSQPSRRAVTIGALGLLAAATCWFLISSRVAHQDAETAVEESVGVILMLLLLVSIIGAARSRHHTDD